MALINIDLNAFTNWLKAFEKTVTIIPNTRYISGISGVEIDSEGTSFEVECPFFKKTDAYNLDKWGIMENADAIMLYPLDATEISRDDKVVFDDNKFRVQEIEKRYLGKTAVYYAVQLYLTDDG